MAITLRLTKGSELTYAELDGNFTDLNTRVSALELSATGTVQITRHDFIADSGDSVFYDSAVSFDSASTQVYLNGILLQPTIDYTLSGKNTVTTTTGLDSSFQLTITSMELV